MNLFENIRDLFGWEFKSTSEKSDTIAAPYVTPENDDAAFVIGSDWYGTSSHQLTLDVTFNDEVDLIRRYRDMALQPEVDSAISDIVNEAINGDNDSSPVELILDDLELSDKIKETIQKEFHIILKKLKFNTESYEIFRKWYVDGKLYYHIILDEKKPKNGIQELRYVSPLNIKKIREERKKAGPRGVAIIDSVEEYFLYTQEKYTKKNPSVGIKLSKDSVCFVTSGLIDEENNLVFSHLHKAIKATNQLKMTEDASIIYRLARAPERRVFYVDTGSLPKNKAEEHMRRVSSSFKNKMVYNATTGEVQDQKNILSIMEDIWLPRNANGRATEVTSLPGGQNLGEMADVEYFKKKLYQSLNVPLGRIVTMDNAQGFTLGRSSEVSREEVKFGKFVSRLRKRFSKLFYELLRTQLLLKQIITPEDWDVIEENITFDFTSDNYFKELKEYEVLRERISMVNELGDMVGKYFSEEYIRKNILQQTDEDIEEMDKQIEAENKIKAEREALLNPQPEEPIDNIPPDEEGIENDEEL